jgi:uncharacterized protein (DUF2062 family)
LREKIRRIVGVNEPPHLIAISFAVGVFFGISPLVGFHTILGLAAAWVFRLNKLVVLSGVYVTNPWSIIPIYTFCTWVGTLMLGTDGIIADLDWNTVTMGSLMNEMRHVLLPFAVGTSAVALVSSTASYFLIRRAVERFRAVRKEAGQ